MFFKGRARCFPTRRHRSRQNRALIDDRLNRRRPPLFLALNVHAHGGKLGSRKRLPFLDSVRSIGPVHRCPCVPCVSRLPPVSFCRYRYSAVPYRYCTVTVRCRSPVRACVLSVVEIWVRYRCLFTGTVPARRARARAPLSAHLRSSCRTNPRKPLLRRAYPRLSPGATRRVRCRTGPGAQTRSSTF